MWLPRLWADTKTVAMVSCLQSIRLHKKPRSHSCQFVSFARCSEMAFELPRSLDWHVLTKNTHINAVSSVSWRLDKGPIEFSILVCASHLWTMLGTKMWQVSKSRKGTLHKVLYDVCTSTITALAIYEKLSIVSSIRKIKMIRLAWKHRETNMVGYGPWHEEMTQELQDSFLLSVMAFPEHTYWIEYEAD